MIYFLMRLNHLFKDGQWKIADRYKIIVLSFRESGRSFDARGTAVMLLDTVKITESNRIDPTAYLEGRGFTVRREGRHLSVRAGNEEHYRIT